MTTDRTSADDHAARLQALRQRRAASRPAPPTNTAEPPAATAHPRRRARRRHAATGGRILAGSLSAAAALGLMGAMANATNPSSDAPTTTTEDVTAVPTVIVISRTAGATEVAAPAAPRVTPTVAAPVTTSRGS
jgi:hypothetical protein